MNKCLNVWTAFALVVGAAACTKSSPTRPSEVSNAQETSSVSDVKLGITVTTPQLATPALNQRFQFTDQPITLTIKNAVTTGSTVPTYSFQVAMDPGFTAVAFTKEGVAEGSGGQTSLKIDKLTIGNKDYYWRAAAVSGGLAGPFTPGRAFNVGPEIVLQPPALSSPAQNGSLSGVGLLVTNNAAKSGPAGQLAYRFEVSDSSSFGNLVFVATVPEQAGGQTTTQMTARLIQNGIYFWRVLVSDPANDVTGPPSLVFSFRYVAFDWSQVTVVNSPYDLGTWPETAKITTIEFTPNAFLVDFDRRTGASKWPEYFPPGWTGGLQYTLGLCINKNDHWYCSAVVQFWDGRNLGDSAPPRDIYKEWFYAPDRWGPMTGYQPSDGETVGIFVGSGNLRDGANFNQATCPRICERSNVALVPWQNGGFASYVFSIGNRVISNGRR